MVPAGVSPAFCTPTVPLTGRAPLVPAACSRPRRASKLRMAAPGPPRQVRGAVGALRDAMQAALTARRSRLAVRLPDGARLGLEKGGGGGEGAAAYVRGDRELARCVAALFEGTGLKVCIAFSGGGEMRAGKKAFGPMSECEFDCWEDGGKEGKRKGKAHAGGKAGGFGTRVVQAAAAVPGAVVAPTCMLSWARGRGRWRGYARCVSGSATTCWWCW
jgi:hypothetical protein